MPNLEAHGERGLESVKAGKHSHHLNVSLLVTIFKSIEGSHAGTIGSVAP